MSTAKQQEELTEANILANHMAGADDIGRAQIRKASLLAWGMRHFGEFSSINGPLPCPTVVWVTKPNSLTDCLNFWNWRALAPSTFAQAPMYLFPLDAFDQWLNLRDQIVHSLARLAQFTPDVILIGHSVPEQALHKIAADLNLEPSSEPLSGKHSFDGTFRLPPYTYLADTDVRQHLVFGRQYGVAKTVQVSLQRHGTMVSTASPIDFSSSCRTLMGLSSPDFLSIPKRPEAAELMLSGSFFKGEVLMFATIALRDVRASFNFPTLPAVAERLLAASTNQHALSDKGRVGLALIEGGNIHLLRRPGMIATIRALTTPRSKDLLRELKKLREERAPDEVLVELAERWGSGRAIRRYMDAKQLKAEKAANSLDNAELLVQSGWAERGFELACTRCGVVSFILLSDGATRVLCPGCGNTGALSRDSAALRVFYRLSTFVDLASDQGSLPPLATIATIQASAPETYIIPGVDITINGIQRELDLFGVWNGKVLAGEVKTASGWFTHEHIRGDIAKSRSVRADIHVIAAKEQIPAEMIGFAEAECKKVGIELLALSGDDLVQTT